MNGHPRTQENCDSAAPNIVPDSSTVGEVTARIRLKWTTADRWIRAGADRMSQVVEKNEKEHFEEWLKKDLLECLSDTFYRNVQQNLRVVEQVDVIIMHIDTWDI